jgi:hypothetical protein
MHLTLLDGVLVLASVAGGPAGRPGLERARAAGALLEHGRPADLPAGVAGVVRGLGLVCGLGFATGFALYGRLPSAGALAAVALASGAGLAPAWRRLSFR